MLQEPTAQSTSLQSKALRRRRTSGEYEVYRAALEWDLTDPIVIDSREDLKSEARWREHLSPFHHQVTNLITFCRRLPVTLLADDVGLGKTISAGLIVTELMSRSRVAKILIVCPKLLGPQWKEELSSKFALPSEIATGSDLIDADPGEEGAIITTYQSARVHLNSIPEDRYDMLILDEAHKLRNLYGVPDPPQVAKTFRKALEARRFRFVLMLTATPIHNRLWDIYSLVDLLTVARGHKNPFGSEGAFARKFIEDSREQARHLKPESRDEFRSIVYSYMSRVRRGDAKLHFPERVVHMHKVAPTAAELEIIKTIAKPIEKLNRLVQISILQALTSSPEALSAQLRNMANKGTVPTELAAAIAQIVKSMPPSAKLTGLAALIAQLKSENPDRWRLIIFTGRLETQTTIQLFLEATGLRVGIINGASGTRNADTLAAFRQNPPKIHIIVSTEAGSEGINLQVANILVNYDLPWNPMIVEQRIGRIQRLASEHQNIAVFNVMLRGTFEEYIVGRLMEKLQMATHAIGDVESLLQGSGLDGDGEEKSSFEEMIRVLIIEALKGKDVEREVKLREESIEQAKRTLETEEAHINQMLGGMDDTSLAQPRCPDLPPTPHSMTEQELTLAVLALSGKSVVKDGSLYRVELRDSREHIRFHSKEDPGAIRSTYYAYGSPAFTRLVDSVVADGIHDVQDSDTNVVVVAASLARDWVKSFGGLVKEVKAKRIYRCFAGTATVRVRSTVAHDSYERLVDVPCVGDVHQREFGPEGLAPLSTTIESPDSLGIQRSALTESAALDPAIEEFSRFYLERRAIEMQAAAEDDRKRQRLEEEFTPRCETTLVTLQGNVYRKLKIRTTYTLGSDITPYSSVITVVPSRQKITELPALETCAVTGSTVPSECLSSCEITRDRVLRHLLRQSAVSERRARPEHLVRCSLSGKSVLPDELSKSSVTGRSALTSLLQTSGISGKLAEPEHMAKCEFTGTRVLKSELTVSQLSAKRFRADQQVASGVSGATGHVSEFVTCSETRVPLAMREAEQCEVTQQYVRRGILEKCAVTGKSVLPSELERCVVSGQRALKRSLVSSSISGARMIEATAVPSAVGHFCLPAEAKACAWSSTMAHPEDLRECHLTGLAVHFRYFRASPIASLQPLAELLDGVDRGADAATQWADITEAFPAAFKKGSIESALFSPNRTELAICFSVRRMLGLRTHQVGCVFDLATSKVVGRLSEGRRTGARWRQG
jgi:superfamily II DNA or RNA helicase